MGKQCTNDVKCCKIMSTSEREQEKPAHGERRMPIMNEVHDIRSMAGYRKNLSQNCETGKL